MNNRFDQYELAAQQNSLGMQGALGLGAYSSPAPVSYTNKNPRELTEVAVEKAKARLEWLQLQIDSVEGWQEEHRRLVEFVKKLERALDE